MSLSFLLENWICWISGTTRTTSWGAWKGERCGGGSQMGPKIQSSQEQFDQFYRCQSMSQVVSFQPWEFNRITKPWYCLPCPGGQHQRWGVAAGLRIPWGFHQSIVNHSRSQLFWVNNLILALQGCVLWIPMFWSLLCKSRTPYSVTMTVPGRTERMWKPVGATNWVSQPHDRQNKNTKDGTMRFYTWIEYMENHLEDWFILRGIYPRNDACDMLRYVQDSIQSLKITHCFHQRHWKNIFAGWRSSQWISQCWMNIIKCELILIVFDGAACATCLALVQEIWHVFVCWQEERLLSLGWKIDLGIWWRLYGFPWSGGLSAMSFHS